MADLKTTYKDDLLDTSVNEKRKYNMIQNADGTVSFEDVTTYSQIGDSFGAADINATNKKVNEVNSNLGGFEFRLSEGNKEVSTDGGITWENFSSGAELLWENPAPSENFAAQTVSVDLSKYEQFIIETNYGTNSRSYVGYTLISKSTSPQMIISTLYKYSGDTFTSFRQVTSVTDTSIKFGLGYGIQFGTMVPSQNNFMAQPFRIYGVKIDM